MKILYIILINTLCCINTFASKNSETVYDNTVITITSVDGFTYERNYSVKILNQYEKVLNKIFLHYDNGKKIKNVLIEVVPKNGKPKTYKKKNLQDVSADGSSVASDDRALYLSINQAQYPYTINVKYTQQYFGTMFFPRWKPQAHPNHAVKEAALKIINEANLNLRFEAFNLNAPKQTGNTFAAFVNFIEPFEFEVYNRNKTAYFPTLYIIAEAFSMYGYKGNMKSWSSYGVFQEQLNQNRNTLSVEQKAEISSQIPAGTSKLDKIKAVYDYLQKNSRYANISLGIGGWQPQPAAYTHQKKYGDCKALSFYTQSILKEFNIDAYYTIIKAGRNNFYTLSEKANPYFNHVILTIPHQQDTIWLECTSQTNPFGYLGTFTSDRQALLLNGKDSKIIRTKKYTAEENKSNAQHTILINEAGTIEVNIQKELTAVQLEESGFMKFNTLSKTEQENRITDLNEIKNFKATSFKVSEPTNEVVPKSTIHIKGTVGSWLKTSSKRVFFNLQEYFSNSELSFTSDTRLKPIYIQFPFTKTDTINFTYPTNYEVESIVEDFSVNNAFGNYSIQQISSSPNSATVVRKLQLHKGKYLPEAYKDIKAFANLIDEKDEDAVVVFKTE